MNNLQETRLFAILSESSQTVLTNEMENAYGDFKKHLIEVYNSSSKTTIYLCLNKARVDFDPSNSILRHGQGKKCANKNIQAKSHRVD